MFLIGLTGGIGSGKSTVAARLAAHGATVIDADAVARDVVRAGTPGFEAVVNRFGPDVVADDGELDRETVAAEVFADDGARDDLNAIVHPRVRERIETRLADLADEPGMVVLDVPLLVESGMHEACDAVVVVTAPEDLRVERLVAARGMAPDDVRARMGSQTTDERRREVATVVIDNDGDLDQLERRVDDAATELLALAENHAEVNS